MGTAFWVGEPNVTGLAAVGTVVLAVLSELDMFLAFAVHAEAFALALLLRLVALRAKNFPGHGFSLLNRP